MKPTVPIHVVMDGKRHGGRDHFDGRAAALVRRGEAADRFGGAGSGRLDRGRIRSQRRVPLAVYLWLRLARAGRLPGGASSAGLAAKTAELTVAKYRLIATQLTIEKLTAQIAYGLLLPRQAS